MKIMKIIYLLYYINELHLYKNYLKFQLVANKNDNLDLLVLAL